MNDDFSNFNMGCNIKMRVILLLSIHILFCSLTATAFQQADPGSIKVLQLISGDIIKRHYPDSLSTLLKEIDEKTSVSIDPNPIIINSFDDPALLRSAILYLNFDDRQDWNLTPKENNSLKKFLERGGFLYMDAGIKSSFLGEGNQSGQRHSFADWQVRPKVKEIFSQIFPKESFYPIPRDHEIFRIYQKGVPNPEDIPEAIRNFVTNEKWPQGTYSLMGLDINNRLAVVASPIVGMGWGKDETGNWITRISFRVRETAEGLSERLSSAAYSGNKFEAKREDGRFDIIYSQREAHPAWVEEPEGRWRIFRYYHGREINDYIHRFYTQLGVDIFVYGICN